MTRMDKFELSRTIAGSVVNGYLISRKQRSNSIKVQKDVSMQSIRSNSKLKSINLSPIYSKSIFTNSF